MKYPKIVCVGGTRPNFIKLAPLVRELDESALECFLLHSGQHYHPTLNQAIFSDLRLRRPDQQLSPAQLGRQERLEWFEREFREVLRRVQPDCVIVVGDVDTSLSAARAAAKLPITIGHVEAGLRSFEADLPEELNRVEIDGLAHVFYTTEQAANENLNREGVSSTSIKFVGNLMADALFENLPRIPHKDFVFETRNIHCEGEYIVATLHRGANVDSDVSLSGWASLLDRISMNIPVIWPVHPRVSSSRAKTLYREICGRGGRVHMTDPLSYLEMLSVLRSAACIITDSGGLQDEATILGTRCFTVRQRTERPVTLAHGQNTLIGDCFSEIDAGLFPRARTTNAFPMPAFWDGHAAKRITADLTARLLS
ncbi:non-hydrolyzing UDP-N-acetylglucosamine 2-epimerase [Rhizobium anhuiense]|uniref:non-hydrolyzing UDP-N-acetylglucosamine 2-epimerase n=1 Tax=Rhizobium anhuiense TaxID=1184720 RepID=UPI0015CF4B5D|nr:UDP-N-acetylglucosamine 2-epimerase (non-hydrolyzing) [Rhizobium anhuiense]